MSLLAMAAFPLLTVAPLPPSYAVSFAVNASGGNKGGRITSSNTLSKGFKIEAADNVLLISLECRDENVTAEIFSCNWGGLVSGSMNFNVTSSNSAQISWLQENCPSGEYIASGDLDVDNCARIGY